MTPTVVPVTADHPMLDRVAAMFDDYRVHYGLPSAPSSTTSWLRDQVTRQRLSAAGFTPVAGLESLTLALDPDPTTGAGRLSRTCGTRARSCARGTPP